MADEFGTVNLKRSDRAREIEMIRQQYRKHRDALSLMASDAPTERLAAEYRRLVGEIDTSFSKLDELEKRGALPDTQPMMDAPKRTEPGTRPLIAPPVLDSSDELAASTQTRLIGIVLGGVLVLGLIGWLLWRASSDGRSGAPKVATRIAAAETTATEADATPVTPLIAEALSAEPAAHDYGIIRIGTRAARQFEIANSTDTPITIQVERSECRCLFYDYASLVPPKGKETITVTVDGAKGKAGNLSESVTVSSKADKSIATTLEINAVIR